MSAMSPRLSGERNVMPIGKPMALSHSLRRTSIGTSTRVRATVTFPVEVLDGCGNWRAEPVRVFVAVGAPAKSS